MKRSNCRYLSIFGVLAALTANAADTLAQPALQERERQVVDSAGDSMWYTTAFIIVSGLLVLAFLLWKRSQKGKAASNDENRYRDYYKEGDGAENNQADGWLRKSKKSVPKPQSQLTFEMKSSKTPSQPGKVTATNSAGLDEEAIIDTKAFQEKMRKMQYAQLPINSFLDLATAKHYTPLEESKDESLLDAIDQANDEFEEDENVRELAVKVLAAFRMRNSVEALSQIALYDLSAALRSKAVAVLTDFDHESVFEPILLACADPTREVRASAARGLFRLNFDRSHAWKRIIETNDEFRMRHAARAAAEAGMVTKAFERLVHDDLKIAYEAFALVALVVRAGETEEIFDAIRNHKDERVRFALLHVIKVLKDERTLSGLNDLQTDGAKLSNDVMHKVRDAIGSFSHVPA